MSPEIEPTTSLDNTPAPRRSGFTLIEMIVVIVVVLVVSGLAISLAAPDNNARRLRESARQVQAMLQGARAKAIETGRPVGVLIEPDGVAPFRASSLQNIEVASSYAGDLLDSRVTINIPNFSDLTKGQVVLNGSDVGWQGLLKVGDLIRFNNQGHFYRIVGPADPMSTSVPPTLDFTSGVWEIVSTDAAIPTGWGYLNAPGVQYEVVRQPETSAGTPLEIPDGVTIDLTLSGISKGGTFPANPGPICLIFSPQGQVAVWMPQDPSGQFLTMTSPGEAIYLMIGQNEALAPVAANTENNLANPNSYWVTIHHQTGQVTTSINHVTIDPALPGPVATPAAVAAARRFSITTDAAGTNAN